MAWVHISHIVTPKAHTSDFSEKVLRSIHSGASHLFRKRLGRSKGERGRRGEE
jgi:hypothetical protein